MAFVYYKGQGADICCETHIFASYLMWGGGPGLIFGSNLPFFLAVRLIVNFFQTIN